MAVTGTANQITIDDIVKQLQLRDIAFLTQSFNRPNLRYIIKDKKNIINDIASYLTEHRNDSGVIYCTGRDACERVANDLREKGFNASHYHAKISTEEKNQTLDDWKCGRINIIVATVGVSIHLSSLTDSFQIAFGMGIDKANGKRLSLIKITCINKIHNPVRFVIHHDLPKSLAG